MFKKTITTEKLEQITMVNQNQGKYHKKPMTIQREGRVERGKTQLTRSYDWLKFCIWLVAKMAAVFLTNHSSSETKAVPHWFWHSIEIGSTTCASGISFASLYWSLGILLKLPFNVTPWMVVFSMPSSSTIFLLFYLLNISSLPLLHLTIFIFRNG